MFPATVPECAGEAEGTGPPRARSGRVGGRHRSRLSSQSLNRVLANPSYWLGSRVAANVAKPAAPHLRCRWPSSREFGPNLLARRMHPNCWEVWAMRERHSSQFRVFASSSIVADSLSTGAAGTGAMALAMLHRDAVIAARSRANRLASSGHAARSQSSDASVVAAPVVNLKPVVIMGELRPRPTAEVQDPGCVRGLRNLGTGPDAQDGFETCSGAVPDERTEAAIPDVGMVHWPPSSTEPLVSRRGQGRID
jgi:hypothetical protein